VKIHLWIPGDLWKRARRSDMDISRVCRDALRNELLRLDRQAQHAARMRSITAWHRNLPYARLETVMRGRQP